MTKEEKKERRRLRHRLMAAVLKNHFHDWKFMATNAQLRAGARIVADQLLAGRNPGMWELIPGALGRRVL